MTSRWVVLKFGGTSVSSRARWETIAAECRARRADGLRPVVVCSAVRGITDQLEGLPDRAVRGEHQPVLDAVAARHAALADELGVDPALVADDLTELGRLATGVAMVGEASPRVRARMLAFGEIMLTRLGAAWLAAALPEGACWVDARDALHGVERRADTPHRRYLSATVVQAPGLVQRWSAVPEPVLVTQGFIARGPTGETVLLGRGGSDTSAALLAAALGAVRCEIWTDVPGLFTANPRDVPTARLLRHLDYDEAQEIATMGAKVLHPRSIPPCRDHDIPMVVRCTPHPELPSTTITRDGLPGSRVKALSTRPGLTLISMDTVKMWQQVGFLADAFAVFRDHGLSIDLVSTSEFNVTVSLDPAANALDPAVLDALVADLAAFCTTRIIGPCASVSLVGRGIRGILHRLGPVLDVFEEQRVHLVSQAASDLNLTFVVDEDQAGRLVRALHGLLFAAPEGDPLFGPAWEDLLQQGPPLQVVAPWWRARRDDLLALAAARSPCYVLDPGTLDAQAATLGALQSVDRVLYAMKANPHPDVLRRFDAAGLGFECVSPGELRHLFATLPGLDPERVLFTPNFAPRAEYAEALALGVRVTLDNLHPLEAWPTLFTGRDVFLRLDPGMGRGHHKHVRTAGAESKFGIDADQLDALADLVAAAGAHVVGLHAHSGSGVHAPETWSEIALFLADAAERFPDARVLDLGGGLGVPDQPGAASLDLQEVDRWLLRFKAARPGFAIWIEPGRFLVAPAGVLLATVTQLKQKGAVAYVGIDTGMNSLIRPALYGAWHPIVNLTRLDAHREITAHVVGPICETGDTLGYSRSLPRTEEGDVLLIGTTGAYGRAMSSAYNLREPADEIVLPTPDQRGDVDPGAVLR